ncbi:MAG: MoxR family ATPase [Succinivibrionaceae bacterium]|nr:MoxR family ATPase [Succinivibrionaceae bacterium]
MNEKLDTVLKYLDETLLDKKIAVRLAVTCLLAKGHLLLEDLPGMGKTTLASAIAKLLGLEYKRVQFTSDMLPADLIGMSIFDSKTQDFTFKPGPLFSQILLADEINRGSSRTQSALLEAMAEYQVSADKVTYPLPKPFFVIATQNPQDQSGTFVLPESELDRFTMRIEIGYPSREAERQMLEGIQRSELPAVLDTAELLAMQEEAGKVQVSENAMNYLLDLVDATRSSGKIPNPLSPRASKALLACARAWAYLKKRDYLLSDDIQAVFPYVAEHRMRSGVGTVGSGNSLSRMIIDMVDPVR